MNKFRSGSAFILVFVLTTLLALVGVMFLLTARVDKLSTSAIAENKQLDAAVDTIISQISQQLVLDTPGVRKQINPAWEEEYYDYPDGWNPWLASLEPEPNGTEYQWRQISDVTGYLFAAGYPTQNVDVKPVGLSTTVYVNDYPDIECDINGNLEETSADADGDGIADSKWITLDSFDPTLGFVPDMTTNKGEPVYAAIRVIDNSAMINVNTAYKFNPWDTDLIQEDGSFWRGKKIDGTSQIQINLEGLARVNDTITEIQVSRCGSVVGIDMNSSSGWNQFNNDMVRRIKPPLSYWPFDISDELELRNRFFLTTPVQTRLENLWFSTIGHSNFKQVPYSGGSNGTLEGWWAAINQDANQPDRRHFLSTYNIDRLIDPFGVEMAYLNQADIDFDAQLLYEQKLFPSIIKYYEVGSAGYNKLAREFAQVAANIKDYGDADPNKRETVTTVYDILLNDPHYGFEPPRMYISELSFIYNYLDPREPGVGWNDANDPNLDYLHRSFGIEIYKEFNKDEKFADWQLIINGPAGRFEIPLNDNLFKERGGRYYVIIFEDPCAPLDRYVEWSDTPANGAEGVDPNVVLGWGAAWFYKQGRWYQSSSYDVYFAEACTDCNYPCKSVIDANHDTPEFIGNFTSGVFDPYGPLPLDLLTKYCWRIDDVNDYYDVNDTGDTLTFTTWPERPSSIYGPLIGPRTVIFNSNSNIQLRRYVQGAPGDSIIVDLVGVGGAADDVNIPPWLVDANDANYSEGTVRSFQRDIGHSRIKRLWNVFNPPHWSALDPTLGHSNSFSWPETLARIQTLSHYLRNVGEVGNIFKKSTYYIAPDRIADRIQIPDTEPDIRLDLAEPSSQDILNFITVFNPPGNEIRVKGRININTAPWYVIAQLPWVSKRFGYDSVALAQAVVAYRDKLSLLPGVVDYSQGRGIGMWDLDQPMSPILVPEEPGFSNKGQLMNVTHDLADKGDTFYNPYYDMLVFGRDKDPNGQPLDQRWYPDMTFDRRTKVDGVPNDFEERDLIFARISDLVTVRSDVFTAYILVRLGQNGPQKRAMAILDRSGVFTPADNVKILKLYEVPDAR